MQATSIPSQQTEELPDGSPPIQVTKCFPASHPTENISPLQGNMTATPKFSLFRLKEANPED